MDDFRIQKAIRIAVIVILVCAFIGGILLARKWVRIGRKPTVETEKITEVAIESESEYDTSEGYTHINLRDYAPYSIPEVESTGMSFNGSVSEKPSWLSKERASNIEEVTVVYNKNHENDYSLVEGIDSDLVEVIEHVKWVNEEIFSSIKKPKYSEVLEKLNSLSEDDMNSFIRGNSLDIEPGFLNEDSLHFFTDFSDKIWFNFYNCLCSVYFFDNTKVVLIPYSTYWKKFTNLKEIIVEDFSETYLDTVFNGESIKLGDMLSIQNDLVEGTYMEDYNGYKILYVNKNSINTGTDSYN